MRVSESRAIELLDYFIDVSKKINSEITSATLDLTCGSDRSLRPSKDQFGSIRDGIDGVRDATMAKYRAMAQAQLTNEFDAVAEWARRTAISASVFRFNRKIFDEMQDYDFELYLDRTCNYY